MGWDVECSRPGGRERGRRTSRPTRQRFAKEAIDERDRLSQAGFGRFRDAFSLLPCAWRTKALHCQVHTGGARESLCWEQASRKPRVRKVCPRSLLATQAMLRRRDAAANRAGAHTRAARSPGSSNVSNQRKGTGALDSSRPSTDYCSTPQIDVSSTFLVTSSTAASLATAMDEYENPSFLNPALVN